MRIETDMDARTSIIMLQVAYKEAAADNRAAVANQLAQSLPVLGVDLISTTVEHFEALIGAGAKLGIIEIEEPEPVEPTVKVKAFGSGSWS